MVCVVNILSFTYRVTSLLLVLGCFLSVSNLFFILIMASDTTNPKNRVKVELKQGHHLADWVRVNGSMPRGNGTRRITAAELAKHNTKTDAWTAYDGRVYNITQYLPYHPGGEPKLMLGVGKDCTDLFNRYHRWVNGHAMLSNCLVGVYVGDGGDIGGDLPSSIPATKKPEPKPKNSDSVAPAQLASQALAQLELHDEGDEPKKEEKKPDKALGTQQPEVNVTKKSDGSSSCSVL